MAPSICSLVTGRIPFQLVLNFHKDNPNKTDYKIWVGENSEVKFKSIEGSITGRAKWKDGFPLKHEIHRSLELMTEQIKKCEILIHKAIAFAIPKILLKSGHSTVFFTPTFPSYVKDGIPMLSEEDIRLNDISPAV